jgi:hypothetical protein
MKSLRGSTSSRIQHREHPIGLSRIVDLHAQQVPHGVVSLCCSGFISPSPL